MHNFPEFIKESSKVLHQALPIIKRYWKQIHIDKKHIIDQSSPQGPSQCNKIRKTTQILENKLQNCHNLKIIWSLRYQ